MKFTANDIKKLDKVYRSNLINSITVLNQQTSLQLDLKMG